MNNTTNYRIFVEKLPRFRVEAESLRRELNTNLNLSLGEVRLLCVYDLFGFSEELLEKSRYTVFGEVVTDSVTDTFDLAGRKYIAVEYLPGQFDQRAASAVDCVRLIDPEAEVRIRSSRLLLLTTTSIELSLPKRMVPVHTPVFPHYSNNSIQLHPIAVLPAVPGNIDLPLHNTVFRFSYHSQSYPHTGFSSCRTYALPMPSRTEIHLRNAALYCLRCQFQNF